MDGEFFGFYQTMSGGGRGTDGMNRFISDLLIPKKFLSSKDMILYPSSCSISSSLPGSSTISGMGTGEVATDEAAGLAGINQSYSCIIENVRNNIADNTTCNM